MGTIIALISLLVSVILGVRQFKQTRRIERIETDKLLYAALKEYGDQFKKIHKKVFDVVKNNEIEFPCDLVTKIAEFYDTYDSRDHKTMGYQRPLRHIYHKVCELIANSFYNEISWQSISNLTPRFKTLTSLIPDLDLNDKPLSIEQDDLFKKLHYLDGADYKLPMIRYFRDLYKELYSSISPSDCRKLLVKVNEIIQPLIKKIENTKTDFKALLDQLNYLETSNKVEPFNISNNQLLYLNIRQLRNLLEWFDDSCWMFKLLFESAENHHDNTDNVTHHTQYL
ncbi:MAG: hypothetical protein PVI75_05760 [Gammaproteobacteria bacterium]|jgi:hypothetical protein